MDILAIASAASTICGVLKESEVIGNYNRDIKLVVDTLVEKKFGHEMSNAKTAHNACKKVYDRIISRENARVNELVNTSEYVEAAKQANAAKAKIDILKKSIENFESDKTSVAVGSGESAIAVSITNSGAKAKLESDLAEAESLYKANNDIINSIKSQAKARVISERTDEFYNAKQAMDNAKHEVDIVTSKMNNYRYSLKTDSPEITNTAIVRNYSKFNIIGVATLKSAFPAYLLYKIWTDAINNLKVLEVAKEAV